MLAILFLNANRVVSVDRLTNDLYTGTTPITTLKQMQHQISELHKTLSSMSMIETHSPDYLIRVSPKQLDLTIFEHITTDKTKTLTAEKTQRTTELLRHALDL